MESDMVTAIVLNIDSPGGNAEGIKEFADVIYNARMTKKKPIYSMANFTAGSAAYYLGSQADKFYATDSALVGSIGVVAVHTETSQKDAKEGIKRTILTVGKHKAEGNPHEPLTDEAKSHHLDIMQEVYDQFVGDVARGRGISEETVLKDFGQGRAYKAKTAHKRGMVDGILTLDNLVGQLTTERSTTGISVPTSMPIAAELNKKEEVNMELSRETLELLGLNEEATSEEIALAISELAARPVTVLSETVVIEEELVTPEFTKLYPEVAAELARLQETDRKNTAKMFAGDYSQFTDDKGNTGFGFSALALENVTELHMKVSDGVVTHSDLKIFLDMVAGGNAIVDYRELGSTRGDEGEESAENGMEAATKLRDMAIAAQTAEGLSYGDALSKVMQENKELADMYLKSVASERGDS
jgi:signal peptide peptidase SppA